MLLILGSFTACKKDRSTQLEDSFDPTKYYITGEEASIGGGSSPTSYVYCFFANAKTYTTSQGGYNSDNPNYTYTDGVIKIGSLTFTIANDVVTSCNNANYRSYHLQKIPDADAFAGKTFKGTVATNGLANGKSCLIKYTTDKKFTVSIDGFGQTGTGADYTLQNNGVATARTGNEGRLHLMTIGDGKLYYSQISGMGTTNYAHYYGVLTLQ
ncbi:hypothetical protein [Pedobacter xixiisoli]|uniref:Uncharacterized protein n=1 Tax=Pedobacter xixiisoli TaxID=1476464 RepID=A0A285ZX50_9SPHI|nr:hypothetical protein [Pedobacter xixiisoli]SOD14231.1 hypothetical protein SAMN06297358_1470 [Pedobacter xixiisoli]